MNREEYKKYQESVNAFFKAEGITSLSPVSPPDGQSEGVCPTCGEEVDNDSHFSWRACECCGSSLGGNRWHASGYNPFTGAVTCYDVCEDCIYYTEYGQLDDMTMMDTEKEER